jgi:hypothetical protein
VRWTDPVIPDDYPWADQHLRTPGVLRWDPEGFVVQPGSTDGPGRTPVAAVGSNAAPAVLARKLAALGSGWVAMEPWALPGLQVGHSAHVSVHGYVPAAPYVGAGTARTVVGWFDDEQLALLDASEPNYLRRRLDAGVDVYASRWGVVAVHGVPVPLTGQAELLRLLRPPALVGGSLSDPSVAARVSDWLHQTHAVDAGWPVAGG